MKNILVLRIAVVLLIFGLVISVQADGRNKDDCPLKYLKNLPTGLKLSGDLPQKYLMTAEYINKDIFGGLQSKVKVRGEYTRASEKDSVVWNNVSIAYSNVRSEFYREAVKQGYMENMKYIPSPKMLEESAFVSFPKNTDNVFARNLIWDMIAIEAFAWNYFDTLSLNKTYVVPDIHGEFDMADIGKYNHANIQLCWMGISMMNNVLCAIIEYRSLENKLEINTSGMKSKGSELYWGTTWVSLKTRQIEHAQMYSNTIQEIEMQGMRNKILVNTTRIISVDKIQ